MNNRELRVALVTGGLPFGGTTAFLLNLVIALRMQGVLASVFSLTQANPFCEEFRASGIAVHLCNEKEKIFEDRVTQTYAELAEFCPAIVISNIGQEAYEMLRYVPEGVPRIGVIHDRAQEPQRVLTTYGGVLDHVIVVAAHLLDEVRTSAPEVSCTHMPHGIALPTNLAPRLPNPSAPLKLIYFGRLTEGKGARLFPKIVNALHRRRVPFTWTIHGAGPDEVFLRQQLAREISSGEVVVSSPIPRDKLFPLLRQHDVYVLASDTEGGPLTLLEAMSLGLVPVCGDIPCLVQEVVTPKTGFRVDRPNPEAYADAIARLHTHRQLLERMSLSARQAMTSDYTLEAMGERYGHFLHCNFTRQRLATWPAGIRPRTMLGTQHPLVFSPISRPLRRLVKRLKSK